MSSSADSLADGIQLLRLADKIPAHSSHLTPPPSDDSQKSQKSTSNHSDHEAHKSQQDKNAYIESLKEEREQLTHISDNFNHVFTLIDKELKRMRGEDVPEPSQQSGGHSVLSEIIMVPVDQYPTYNFVGRILGPRGTTAKQIESSTGCRVTILGRNKKDVNGPCHHEPPVDNGPLRVQISVPSDAPEAAKRMETGVAVVKALLIPPADGQDELKRQQLMVLANRNINDYSPILLNDMSFIGSQSAPQFYSRRMWRRLNVALIQFIVNKLAEMLTTPDAELMELLTDAGDAKQMKNPSIWQRLNPLQMESSKCIDESLATRVADLIIGYQFFINDKKNRSQKLDGSFAKSNIQDAEELELFAKTPEFEKIIEGILSEVDINSMDDKQDELSCCINKLLENVPTTTLVEKYSQVVLEKSVRFFEFLKMFFTSAYIHLRNENIFSPSSLDTIKRERMQKQKYDAEFLKSVGYDMRSTVQDTLLTVTPTEPLNVFVSTAVTDIYSQVFTILNMLHIALDAVIETRNSDTLSREPRLRFAFFHMNTTVFAIRKNMLSLIEASYETLMKTLDFKKSSETRSSYELLNVCYRAHRRFIRDVAGALMLTSKRGTTGRVIRLMVSSVSQASKACVNGDAVGAEKHYHQFQTNLLIFLDQCRLDHIRYPLYRSLEIGNDEADGRRSLSSSYSDDLSCRSY